MKIWPFGKQETRQDSYADSVIGRLVSVANGELTGGKTAAVEASAGLWGRCFAQGRLKPEGSIADALNPAILYSLGRDLCLVGRWIAEISVGPNGLQLDKADAWNVSGTGPASEWLYELSFDRPSGVVIRTLDASRVIDVRLGTGLAYGAPIGGAGTTATLLDSVEGRLAQEANTAVAYVLPTPPNHSKDVLASDITSLRGKLGFIETTKGAWDGEQEDAPLKDFETARIGTRPPAELMTLRSDAENSIFAAAGVPLLSSITDGTSQREGLRRLLHSTIDPVTAIALVEFALKLDAPGLSMDYSRLGAIDISGRSRAFGSLVQGGMSLEEAARISGVLNNED